MANVLAKVNGKEITQQDLEMLLQTLGPQRAGHFQGEEGQKQLLDELINQELFYFDAVESKLDETDDFKLELEKVKENIMKQMNIRNLLSGAEVEESELKSFYEANIDNYNNPPMVKASHILVDEETQANDIIAEINGGLSFEEAATKYSKCPSKSNGGDLGFFGQGQMVPEFEEASFGLELNALSGAVKTQFGYHVIKVLEKKDAETKSFDEVKSELWNQMLVKEQNKLYLGKVEELKGKFEVEVL